MKRGATDHWKMEDLAKRLKIPARYAIAWANGCMERLWHYTAKYAIQGDIGKVPDEAIARAIGWPVEDTKRLVDALVASGWLDADKKHRLIVHDWHDHCDDSTKKTLKNRELPFVFPESSSTVDGNKSPALALALAFPLPKPEPLPEDTTPPLLTAPTPPPPTTETKPQTFPLDPIPDQDFGFQFSRIYSNHPYKAHRAQALGKWNEILQTSANPGRAADAIEANHARWLPYWNEPGRFKPTLFQYFDDEKYLSEPPDSEARARDAPAEQKIPKSKFQLQVEEAKRRSALDEQNAS